MDEQSVTEQLYDDMGQSKETSIFKLETRREDLDLDEADSTQSSMCSVSKKKQMKHSTTEAANELELRRVFAENKHRALADIGESLRYDQNGPSAEKVRQIFAMCWLHGACKQDRPNEAVPRGRVYSRYVDRCNYERVKVLNPASFGKLVRIVFANIRTRRLGVRGQSKYNYCGLTLAEDGIRPRTISPHSAHDRFQSFDPAVALYQTGSLPVRQPPSAVDKTARSSATGAGHWGARNELTIGARAPDVLPPTPHGSGPPDRPASVQLPVGDPANRLFQPAGLSQDTPDHQRPSVSPWFPDIHGFLPPQTDPDVADVLNSLYRAHCTSLIENLRHIKLRSFWSVFGSFNGTLTAPVHRLFSDPCLTFWIKLCDAAMYYEMVKMLTKLTNLAVPPLVLQSLSQISMDLCNQISASCSHYPDHVLKAKLEPARRFQALLKRLVKVNEATHAVGKLVTDSAERAIMLKDWNTLVDFSQLAECELPRCARDQTLQLLVYGVSSLLGNSEDETAPQRPAEPPLDKWIALVDSIRPRFPSIGSWIIIAIVERVTSTILRDITSKGGTSFNAWWILKMWIDEKMRFVAEEEAFLPMPQYGLEQATTLCEIPFTLQRRTSRPRAGDMTISEQGPASRNVVAHSSTMSYSPLAFDDSGIGLHLSEEGDAYNGSLQHVASDMQQ